DATCVPDGQLGHETIGTEQALAGLLIVVRRASDGDLVVLNCAGAAWAVQELVPVELYGVPRSHVGRAEVGSIRRLDRLHGGVVRCGDRGARRDEPAR